MDYQEVSDYLEQVALLGSNYGLHNTRRIVETLPTPPDTHSNKPAIIQVAGTNGKGSTAHFLASVFQAAGLSTGLFTSPHLYDVRERVILNNQQISPTHFAAAFTQVKQTADDLLQEKAISGMPTYFEYTFLTAYHYFRQQQVDIAVIEVGLGGRLDATSVLTPDAAVITGISHDHTRLLGKRLADIAQEKAGIIKPAVPVIYGGRPSNTGMVVKRKALSVDAPFHYVQDTRSRLEVEEEPTYYRCRYTTPTAGYEFEVHMNGLHQTRNAATAVKTIEVLRDYGFQIPLESISRGIRDCRIPARIETMDTSPPVILDTSHNIQSIQALADFLEQRKKTGMTLVFGVLSDKKYRPMIKLLLPYIKNVVLTQPESPRAVAPEKLLPMFQNNGIENIGIRKTLPDALNTARAYNNEVLVTGSFYLVGAVRHIILQGG